MKNLLLILILISNVAVAQEIVTSDEDWTGIRTYAIIEPIPTSRADTFINFGYVDAPGEQYDTYFVVIVEMGVEPIYSKGIAGNIDGEMSGGMYFDVGEVARGDSLLRKYIARIPERKMEMLLSARNIMISYQGSFEILDAHRDAIEKLLELEK